MLFYTGRNPDVHFGVGALFFAQALLLGKEHSVAFIRIKHFSSLCFKIRVNIPKSPSKFNETYGLIQVANLIIYLKAVCTPEYIPLFLMAHFWMRALRKCSRATPIDPDHTHE